MHPFNSAAAGKNATLAKWGETTGLSFDSTGFTVNGTTYEDGFDCNGQPATVSLYVWSADDLEAAPTVVSAADIGDFRFDQNRLAITLAVVPPGTDVPPPPTVGDLDNIDRGHRRGDQGHHHDDRGRGHRHHRRAPRPRRWRAPSEGGGPGRRVRDPAPSADLDDPQADAPDRRPAHDRAGRRRPGPPRRHRCRAVAGLPARRLHGRLPRRAVRRVSPCTTRSSPSLSTRPAPSASPPPRPASTTPSSWSTATCSPTSTSPSSGTFHREPGRRGHHRPHPGRRSLPLRRRAHRRQGPGHRLRREARSRHRPHQLDQRRHLRARALGARAHPRRPQGLDRARDLPRDGHRRHAVRPPQRLPTGSTPAPRTPTSRSSSTSSTACGATRSRRCTRVPTSTPPPSSTTRS